MMIGADVYLDSTAHNHEETEETKKNLADAAEIRSKNCSC